MLWSLILKVKGFENLNQSISCSNCTVTLHFDVFQHLVVDTLCGILPGVIMSSPSAFRKSICLRLFTIDHFTKSPYPDEVFLHLAFLVFVECTAGMREWCGGRGLGGDWGAKAWWKPYLAHFHYLQWIVSLLYVAVLS